MGKASRLKKLRRLKAHGVEKRFAQLFEKNFQKEIRNSEIWDQMVAEFGEEKALQMLKDIKVQAGPGDKI